VAKEKDNSGYPGYIVYADEIRKIVRARIFGEKQHWIGTL